MKSIAVVIPARLDSKRLPGKLLLKWKNKEILRHVFEAVDSLASECIETWIATDNQKIRESVESWGGKVFLSTGIMQNGTERVQDFSTTNRFDFYVNVQGDDPTMSTEVLKATIAEIQKENFQVVTPHYRIYSRDTLVDPNKVKLVKSTSDKVLYFSRSSIPYQVDERSALEDFNYNSDAHLGHIGVYAYTRAALERYVSFPESKLEKCEKLEQLRFLENSIDIGTFQVDFIPNSIDTIEDLEILDRRKL